MNKNKLNHNEIRIGVVGNVDVGKSSLISVLTNNVLDNGRGSARSKVMKHPHEKTTGRTSSITLNFLRLFYDDKSQLMKDSYYEKILTEEEMLSQRNRNNKKNESSLNKNTDVEDMPNINIKTTEDKNEKTITLIDLAGHEKYLKTTIQGINGASLDYIAILVGSNSGLQKMTKEHLEIACAMNIPIILVFTKIDMVPKSVVKQNIDYMKSILKSKKFKVLNVQNDQDISMINNFYNTNNFKKIIPLFKISSVSGEGILKLKKFISNLENIQKWDINVAKDANFLIDNSYSIKGIGTVVSGVLKQGVIKKGDELNIGPIRRDYYKVLIKSIHNNFREEVSQIYAGQGGCFAIKILNNKNEIKRSMIKKGMRISKIIKKHRKFSADIVILHHPTTITKRYQPMIHCCGMSQAAKIKKMEQEQMRSGDKSRVEFELIYRPEYIEEDKYLIFREGTTKGIGKVVGVY